MRRDHGLSEHGCGAALVTTVEHLMPRLVEHGVDARIHEVAGVQNRGPQQHERRVVRDRRRDRAKPSLRDGARQRQQRRVDEVIGKIAEQPPVPCLAGQQGAGQVAAGCEDRDGTFPQGMLVLHRHDPRHRIRPQVVRAVPAIVQHPDQRNLPGQVIEVTGPPATSATSRAVAVPSAASAASA